MGNATYTLGELKDFIARHPLLAQGLVERDTVQHWWRLGWVRLKGTGANTWELTPLGQRHIDNPPR